MTPRTHPPAPQTCSAAPSAAQICFSCEVESTCLSSRMTAAHTSRRCLDICVSDLLLLRGGVDVLELAQDQLTLGQ